LKFQQETPEAIRQYLLGILPHEQMAQFEERLLADDELYEELLIGEEEILDDFLGDEVSPSERERIETYFLQTPARQEQLCFAGTLRSYASEHGHRPLGAEEVASRLGRVRIPPARKTVFSFLFPRNPALAFSLTSALLVVIVGGIWLAVRTRNHSKAPQTVWAVELTPGLMRDEGVIKTSAIP